MKNVDPVCFILTVLTVIQALWYLDWLMDKHRIRKAQEQAKIAKAETRATIGLDPVKTETDR